MNNRLPDLHLDQDELRSFFLSHLNRIYCAKSELVEKLPELGKRIYFLDLKQAIDATVDVVRLQIQKMRQSISGWMRSIRTKAASA